MTPLVSPFANETGGVTPLVEVIIFMEQAG
jgi:hypothetical protein